MKRRKSILIWLLIIFLGAGLYYSYQFYGNWQKSQKELRQRRAGWRRLKQLLAQEIKHFNGETGIVIKDLNMGWEIYHKKDKLFPAASLVKVPLMASCFYAAQEKKIDLQTQISLKARHKTGGSGILKGLPPGLKFSIEELITFMILYSDNTACNILIDLLGPDYVQHFFRQAGLRNTNLSRKMMDFKQRRRGRENYTTAEDIASILEKIYRRQLLEEKLTQECLELLKSQKINDRIPARLPAGTTVAHKTGLEFNVCHDAGIVFAEKGDLLICVLTNTKNVKEAKRFISTVALYAYSYL